MLSQMSDPNYFGSDKMPKWSDNVCMLTIVSNTVTICISVSSFSPFVGGEGVGVVLQSHAFVLKFIYIVIGGNTYSIMVNKFSSTTFLPKFKS